MSAPGALSSTVDSPPEPPAPQDKGCRAIAICSSLKLRSSVAEPQAPTKNARLSVTRGSQERRYGVRLDVEEFMQSLTMRTIALNPTSWVGQLERGLLTPLRESESGRPPLRVRCQLSCGLRDYGGRSQRITPRSLIGMQRPGIIGLLCDEIRTRLARTQFAGTTVLRP